MEVHQMEVQQLEVLQTDLRRLQVVQTLLYENSIITTYYLILAILVNPSFPETSRDCGNKRDESKSEILIV